MTSMMDVNPPGIMIIPLDEKAPKGMVVALEVEKVLQALTMTHPKEIQMALEGQVVLVAKETALMTLVMTFLPAEKGLNLMVKVAKHHKILMMIEKDESLPKIIICLEEKDHKEKVDLAVEKEAMMISLEERILKMEMQMPVIFMEGKDQSLAQILPIAEDQEMTSMKKIPPMIQMRLTTVAKVQGMIQMTPTTVAEGQDMIQMTPTIVAKGQGTIQMIPTIVAKALLGLMQVIQMEEKAQETMQISQAAEDLKIDMEKEMMMMLILIPMIPMVKHQDLEEKVPKMT